MLVQDVQAGSTWGVVHQVRFRLWFGILFWGRSLLAHFKHYEVYFSRTSGSGMRPVHQVVRVVTHCSEAWKVGSTLPRNTNRHSKEPESTRFARCFCGIWSPCTSNEDRQSKTACHLCLSHTTAETTGNHLRVSSDLSWRNPGSTVETYCGLWSPGKTSSQLYLHN